MENNFVFLSPKRRKSFLGYLLFLKRIRLSVRVFFLIELLCKLGILSASKASLLSLPKTSTFSIESLSILVLLIRNGERLILEILD